MKTNTLSKITFLCAYLHGKRVMPLACERVRTCRMRAFTLFLENLWRVTYDRNVEDSFLSLLTNTQLKLIILVVCPRSCQFHIFSPLLFCGHFLSSDGSLVSVEWSPTILK